MDFELPEEYQAFRDMVRRWVDNEAPKDWARSLEMDEHNYPFALWDKFAEAGFHGVGISEDYEGQGGDVVMQIPNTYCGEIQAPDAPGDDGDGFEMLVPHIGGGNLV